MVAECHFQVVRWPTDTLGWWLGPEASVFDDLEIRPDNRLPEKADYSHEPRLFQRPRASHSLHLHSFTPSGANSRLLSSRNSYLPLSAAADSAGVLLLMNYPR